MPIDRTTFLADRLKGVGGSDIASVFNVGYGCRRRLWYQKTSTPEDFPRKDTKVMRFGRVLEAEIAAIYSEETGRRVETLSVPVVSTETPNLRVNVDRMVWRAPIHSAPGPLEVKAVGREMFYRFRREGLSVDYIWQLQAGILAADATWGCFAVGCRDNGEVVRFDVPRSEELCNEIKIEIPKFWALVENGPTPDRLNPDDRRCQGCEYRTTCQGAALVSIAPASDYTPDESLRPLVREFLDRRALAKEAESLLNETKEELKTALGSRGMVAAAGAKIQYYEIEKKEYVVKAHKERPLRIYEGKK